MDFFENRPDRKPRRELPPELNQLSERVISACIEVHRHLGPGLNESIYELAACHEMELRDIPYEQQVELPVLYKGEKVGLTRIDLLIDRKLIIEFKACDQLIEVHRAQLLTYLQLTRLDLGLLINFNNVRLVDGIKRVIRAFP
jgi:GxxExxY protein